MELAALEVLEHAWAAVLGEVDVDAGIGAPKARDERREDGLEGLRTRADAQDAGGAARQRAAALEQGFGVVAGVDGPERNVFWKRLDDGSRPGYAEIVEQGAKVFGPGDVVTFLPDSIHSVANDTDRVTISLHVYGKHVNYTTRSQFDPHAQTAREFKVTQTV